MALGAEFTVEQEVALDALDEWMELGSIHFHATDTASEAAVEWLIDLNRHRQSDQAAGLAADLSCVVCRP